MYPKDLTIPQFIFIFEYYRISFQGQHAMADTQIIHTDQQYVTGLLENDAAVIDTIYQKFAPGIKRWIVKNNGSVADAGDIFQEAMITIFRQAREKGLKLSCPFEAYLLIIVKRMWFNELKKRGRRGVTIDIDEVYDIGTDNRKELEDAMEEQEKENRVMAFFETFGDRCREIIRLCLKKESSQDEIADRLGISYAYLRKKKSECMAQLIKKVRASAPQI